MNNRINHLDLIDSYEYCAQQLEKTCSLKYILEHDEP